MSIEPILRCRRCGFLTRSPFGGFGAGSSVSIMGCTTQCSGCRRVLPIPDMNVHSGDLFIFHNAQDVDLLIAQVVEFTEHMREVQRGGVTEIDEQKVPDYLKWAIPFMKRNPALISLVVTCSLMIALQTCGQQQNRRLLDEQLAHTEALEKGRRADDASESALVRARLKEIAEILERIAGQQFDSERELSNTIRLHNEIVNDVHRLIQENLPRPLPQPASSVNDREVKMDAHTARNSPCPCGSGRKFKHCHGHPQVRNRADRE